MMTERPLRILALDDSESDVKLMERSLRAADLTFATRRVETREAFDDALRREPYDVIFVDYKLPHFDGLSALRLAKLRQPAAPVIVVTGSLSDELAAEFLQEGAADYILKDRRSRLAVAVRKAVNEARLRAEQKAAADRYQALFAQSRDAIALLDCPGGRISSANAAFERLSGRAREELIGVPVDSLASADTRASLKAQLDSGCTTTALFLAKFDLQRPDGARISVQIVGSLSHDVEGPVVQVLCHEIPVSAGRASVEHPANETPRPRS